MAHPRSGTLPLPRRSYMHRFCCAAAWIAFSVTLLGAHLGCTLTTFDPVLTSTLSGLTLERLVEIQSDERLTAVERRAAVREALELPDTDEGNRLADFLLNLTLP